MARLKDRDQAIADTVMWCQVVKTASKKTDSEILDACFERKDAPSAQTFNRWLNGKHAMPPDKLQEFTRNASKRGWIKRPSMLITTAQKRGGLEPDRRVDLQGKQVLNSVLIRKHNRTVKRLHEAQNAAIASLTEFRKAIKDAKDVICLDELAPKEGGDPEFYPIMVQEVIRRIQKIGFIDTSPWAK